MVTKCVCYDKTFAEMKLLIEKFNINTIDGLRAHIPFGMNCKLCVPYVEQVFITGKTSFDVIDVTGDIHE
jgi:bacterioferritin-associated ferredoxin